MSLKQNEINDNEIRIISAKQPKPANRKKRLLYICLILVAAVILSLVIYHVFTSDDRDADQLTEPETNEVIIPQLTTPIQQKPIADADGFTVARDTVISDERLLILTPENARPKLVIGAGALNDSSIILATQAADIRRDNGKIAGTFVLDGELMGKGEAKAGYCAIINGELSIGVADATPMLEQALIDNGYFFRQYPLVVGGQVVENRPKGKSIRKALADIGGKTCVVISREKLSFHDFSHLLVDAGARNAIYLVGSASYGFYVNDKGEKVPTGKAPWTEAENINYIIWERE